MISALLWIPRGAAKEHPIKYELSAEEMQLMFKKTKDEIDPEEYEKNVRTVDVDIEEQGPLDESQVDDDVEETDAMDAEGEDNNNNMNTLEPVDISEFPAELKMDKYDEDDDIDMNNYDDEEEEDNEDGLAITQIGDQMYALNNDGEEDDEDDDEEEDEDDNHIRPVDNVLVTAVTEEDASEIHVWVLTGETKEKDDDAGNLYLHHSFDIPQLPLCLAWMDIPPFRANATTNAASNDTYQSAIGSYLAVGMFKPVIEIWNLDVLNPLEPTASLGGVDKVKTALNKVSAKTGKRKKVYLPGSHTDAVMGLHWNAAYRQALASSSADGTAKIWDVTVQTCLTTFTHHTDKVHSVKWNPATASLLATASYDKTVSLVDCLTPNNIPCSYNLSQLRDSLSQTIIPVCDVECIQWNPFNEHELFVSLENGYIVCIDKRNNQQIQYCFQAHAKTVSSISFSKEIPNMLCTASIDKTVKIWDSSRFHSLIDTKIANRIKPTCLSYKTMADIELLALDYSYIMPNTANKPQDNDAMENNSNGIEEDDRALTNTGGYLLACGGSGNDGAPAVWYSDELQELTGHFRQHNKDYNKYYNSYLAASTPGASTGHTKKESKKEHDSDVTMDNTSKKNNK